MANSILTPSLIAREITRLAKNNLVFASGANKEYSDRFAKTGGKIGDSIDVRNPARFSVSDGATFVSQNYDEKTVPVTINKRKHIGVTFTRQELTLDMQDFSKRVLAPQVIQLANQIDQDGLELFSSINNAVGTPGTQAGKLRTYSEAKAKMDNEGLRFANDRTVIIDPLTEADFVDKQKGLFQSSSDIASQYKNGTIGKAAGFDFKVDQNIPTHTVGSAAGDTISVNGAAQTGSTLTVAGLTGTLNKGDIFTIAGVYAVNPLNRLSTGELRQFVVTATTTGGTTIPIYPAIVASGKDQTVTNSPANAAAILVNGAAGTLVRECLAYHKDAFTLAMVDLEDVSAEGAWCGRASDKDSGLSFRITRQYDVSEDVVRCRIDALYGWAVLRPDFAVRVRSGALYAA